MDLRQYQKEISELGLNILRTYHIVYLSMEVRTGKTNTAFEIAENYGASSVLMVTKKKAITKIQMMFEQTGCSFFLLIINYDKLHTLRHNNFDLIIIDEAQAIGQFPIPAVRTRALKKICKDKPIIYLSGTPSPESYSQLYHQFYISSFSPFAQYSNFYKWAKDFVMVKKKYFYNRESNDYSYAIKKKVEDATKHLFISFTQKEAGFTQMVNEEILTVEMLPSTYELVNRLRTKKIYTSKRDGSVVLGDTAVKLMNKLHQIYSGTVISEEEKLICFDATKANFIRDRFAGKKIAIFYKFRAELELIRWAMKGQITDDPEHFNEANNLTFVSQVQAGREGIDLSTAEALIMYNIDFSSLSYLQAKARIQTLDRETPANLYWIFAMNGIEHKIYKRVKNKQNYTLSYFKKDYGISRSKEDQDEVNEVGMDSN